MDWHELYKSKHQKKFLLLLVTALLLPLLLDYCYVKFRIPWCGYFRFNNTVERAIFMLSTLALIMIFIGAFRTPKTKYLKKAKWYELMIFGMPEDAWKKMASPAVLLVYAIMFFVLTFVAISYFQLLPFAIAFFVIGVTITLFALYIKKKYKSWTYSKY